MLKREQTAVKAIASKNRGVCCEGPAQTAVYIPLVRKQPGVTLRFLHAAILDSLRKENTLEVCINVFECAGVLFSVAG